MSRVRPHNRDSEPLLTTLLLAAVLAAQPLGGVRAHRLDNGLTVLLLEDRRAPLVAVGVMYRVGARDEAPGITGIAHYVEHMVFRDLEGFAGSEATESITRIGGRWSGYTWIDQTFYRETVPRSALAHALEIQASRMRGGARFDPDAFRRERTSVIAELHSYDDPHSTLYDAVLATSFEIHPYRFNTIGWLSDVEGITRDEAHEFYRRHYHPGNAVLVIAGDFDPRSAIGEVGRRFAEIPRGGGRHPVRTVEPPQTGPKRVVVKRPGPRAEVLIAWRAPALTDPAFAPMVVFDALLAGGKGLRPLQDYDVPAATPLLSAATAAGASDARSQWQVSLDPYVYLLRADAPAGADLARVESALFRAVREAAAREWTEPERARALRELERGYRRDLDEIADRVHQLALFEVAGGHRHLAEMPARLAAVGTAEATRFAARWLNVDAATVGWFLPQDSIALPSSPAAPSDLAARPAEPPGPVASPASLATVAPRPPLAFRLENGLEAIVAPGPGAGLVAVAARIDAGAVWDGAASGVAALVVEQLASLPSLDPSAPPIAWSLHERPGSAANARWLELEAQVLPDELAPLLRDLAARLRAPAPAPDAFAERVAAVRERARAAAVTPELAGWAAALRALWPAGSARAAPPWAGEHAFAALDTGSLARFLQAHAAPDRCRIAIAGAVDEAAARGALQEAFGDWRRSGGAGSPAAEPARGSERWRELRVPFPGRARNELLVAWPGDRSKPADAAATRALLYLLGETHYAGRLGRALVEPGLVYSVWAALEEDGVPGFLAVHTAAAPGDTAEVLRRIRDVLEGAAGGGFTGAELAEAADYLRGKAARSHDGAIATARTLLRGGGPEPELPSLEQLNDAARRLFRNGAPIAIVVGPGY